MWLKVQNLFCWNDSHLNSSLSNEKKSDLLETRLKILNIHLKASVEPKNQMDWLIDWIWDINVGMLPEIWSKPRCRVGTVLSEQTSSQPPPWALAPFPAAWSCRGRAAQIYFFIFVAAPHCVPGVQPETKAFTWTHNLQTVDLSMWTGTHWNGLGLGLTGVFWPGAFPERGLVFVLFWSVPHMSRGGAVSDCCKYVNYVS